jgi:hypothetical protein
MNCLAPRFDSRPDYPSSFGRRVRAFDLEDDQLELRNMYTSVRYIFLPC